MSKSATIHRDYIRAGSPQASSEALRLLSISELPDVRRRVAENATTPADVLDLLSLDSDPQVRVAVGLNTKAPINVVSRLVYDDDPDVRHYLASASYLAECILIELMADANPYVAQRAASTMVLAQSGFSPRTLTVFEFLQQDHSLLVNRLEKLIERAASGSKDCVFDEIIDACNGLRRHFRRQQHFCLERIGNADEISPEVLKKSELDHLLLESKLQSLIAMHRDREHDFCHELRAVLELLLSHIKFAEMELFTEVRRQATVEQINEMNANLNQVLNTRSGQTC